MAKNVRNKIIIIHSVFWLYELVFSFLSGDTLGTIVWINVLFVPIVYLHYFILIPRIIKEPTFVSFLKWYMVFFVITFLRKQIDFYVGKTYLDDWGWIDLDWEYDFYQRVRASITLAVSNSSGILAITLGSRYVINKAKAEKLQRQKSKNELYALKNQIDIAETINILAKLEQKAKLDPSSVENAIVQLSNVLRYHLYSNQGAVNVAKELDIVADQISLYNELNTVNLALIHDTNITKLRAGMLSKVMGEVLKDDYKLSCNLRLYENQAGYTILQIDDLTKKALKALISRLGPKFKNQLVLKVSEQSVSIQLS